MNQYREGKVKSTAMSGVKQFLKPDAYKQSERGRRVLGARMGKRCFPYAWLLVPCAWVTAYLLYNGSASWSY